MLVYRLYKGLQNNIEFLLYLSICLLSYIYIYIYIYIYYKINYISNILGIYYVYIYLDIQNRLGRIAAAAQLRETGLRYEVGQTSTIMC